MIGVHTVTIAGVDVSCLIDEVSIAHGRSDTTGQPDASGCTIDLTVTPEAPLPAVVDIGAELVVSTVLGVTTFPRFRGRVTDIALGWDDAGENTPDAGTGQIIAVGKIADLARRIVGDAPFPAELDGARVSRVASLAGLALNPATSDPGTVNVLARDIDRQDALAVIHDTAESSGGMLWETRDGDVRYADADHRRGVTPSLDLDSCDVLVTPTWTRNLDGLVNAIAIGYGGDAAGGTYVAENPTSIAKYGRYARSVTTELAAQADAAAMGQLVLVRNSSPVWVLSALPVDLSDLKEDETAALLSLDVHALIRVTGMPAIGSAPTATALWIEGWTERLAWDVHDVELYVSGYCRTVPPPHWDDVDPSWLWDTIPPLTWDETTCLGPPADLGRWDDTAASLRWDQVPAAQIWDTWASAPAPAMEGI